MSTKKILHFGLNRSGTNYLKELLLRHFDLEFLNREEERDHPLHKHFRIYDDKTLIGRPNFSNTVRYGTFADFEADNFPGNKPDLYVIISKDPYSWHLSYKSWGEKNNWEPSPHPFVYEYNKFYKKWLEFSEETNRIVFVKYTDLLKDSERILRSLAERFGLDQVKPIEADKRIKKVPMSHRFSQKRLRYYLENQYLDEFTSAELQEINRNIDHELIRKLGYKSYF